jgi:hypothetical protein
MTNRPVPYSDVGLAVYEQLDTWLQTWLLAGGEPELAAYPFTIEENQTLVIGQVVGLNARGKIVPATVSEATTYFVSGASVAAGGTGGTNGPATVTGTTGTGTKFQASVTIAGGAITAVNSITVEGSYTVAPTTPAVEPVTGASLTGAELNVTVETLVTATAGIQALGVMTQNITTVVGDDQESCPVWYSGCFSLRGLTFDASFVADSDKLHAFRGAPTPTTITVRKRQSDV